MSKRYFRSTRLRAAQLEYSRAESAMCEQYDHWKRIAAACDTQPVGPMFTMREVDGPDGNLLRLFVCEGREPSLRAIVGDAPVDRWLNARAEVDSLYANPRHYRVEESASC